MTDDELDLLASSFLDGEATPDEVALIEGDPTLLARVEELRLAQAAVRTPVPPPSMRLKEDQLAAALAAFDAADRRPSVMAVDQSTQHVAEPAAGPVIDLRARRARREQRESEAAGRMRWLSAVAGVLVFTAGAVFLVSQVDNGGDDAEFAGDVPAAETAATESAEAQLAPANEDTGADADMGAADDGGDGAAIASEAMRADAEDDFARDAEDEAVAEESAAADADSGPTIQDLAEEGFFGDEPVARFTSVPTSDELLAQLDLPWRNPDSARCATLAELPDGAQVIGSIPIEIPATGDGAGTATTRVVEALYLTVGTDSLVILLDPDTCEAA